MKTKKHYLVLRKWGLSTPCGSNPKFGISEKSLVTCKICLLLLGKAYNKAAKATD